MLPLQAPEPVQAVAFVLDQVSVEFAFASTSAGLAEMDTVGAVEPVTEMVTERLVLPPPPLHVSV